MNKKGFTLVELLAVIAILAILVVVALPNVLGMFNQAKEDTFATETKDMVRIVQQQYLANFGKWNYYAIEGSKDENWTTVSTRVCTSTVGPEFELNDDGSTKTDASGEPVVKTYCKIDKDSGNLTRFIISFNASTGNVKKIVSSDETYSYHFPNTEATVFDAREVKNNGLK